MSSSSPRGEVRVEEPAAHIARLVISHPARRGALSPAILEALTRIVPALRARCLIVTGEPGTFSAGFDIGDLPDEGFDAGEAQRHVDAPFAAALDAIERYPYPTVAALSGHAIGGGLELALACDLRIAADGARLGMPPARLGVVYSHAGMRRFLDVLGAARTRQLFHVGDPIDAATALQWGLVGAVHPPQELPAAALALASRIAAGAPLAQVGNKQVIRAALDGAAELPPQRARELEQLRLESFASADFREGVRAFAEKRSPEWTGS